jgi:hypothetical protein
MLWLASTNILSNDFESPMTSALINEDLELRYRRRSAEY